MDKGWIKLSRGVKDNLVWQDKPFSKGQAWIDLLLSVNHTDKTILINGNARKIKKGQCWTSEKKLAERWGWSRNKVRHFLHLLKVQGMVATEGTGSGTALTIVNWGKYQKQGTAKGTAESTAEGTTEGTTEGTQTRMYKNEKRIKEGSSPTLEEPAAAEEEEPPVPGAVKMANGGWNYHPEFDWDSDEEDEEEGET